MVAMGHFFVDRSRFTTYDFTLSNWAIIDTIGVDWVQRASEPTTKGPTISAWEAVLPSLDVWLAVGTHEIHYVRSLLPTLNWTGGQLGVRLRFEPKVLGDLYKEYLAAFRAAKKTKQAGAKEYTLTLWPQNLRGFLDRKLRRTLYDSGLLARPNNVPEPDQRDC